MTGQAGSSRGAGGLARVREGLRRTREGILGRITALLHPGAGPARDWSVELEAALIEADLGPRTASSIAGAVRDAAGSKVPDWDTVRVAARTILKEILASSPVPVPPSEGRPRVILVVGVNGGGKTTTVAKLGRRLAGEGQKVLLCAADTFRAGACEQLQVWAERAGVDFMGREAGADPSSVVYDATVAAGARGADVLIVDTAGRLHTQDPLMRELEKMVRVVGRRVEGAPHEVLLVLDATTGQNGVDQAREFLAAARVNGLVLTKVDGTARGGVALRIVQELRIPLRYLGVGEGLDDLVDFNPDDFLEGLLPSAA